MSEMFGYSFTPGLQKRFTNSINGQSALTSGQSQALQVLALKLPGFLGGNTPAPEALLRRPLGGSRPDLAVRAQVTGQTAPSSASSAPGDTQPSAGQPSNPSDVFSRMSAPSEAPRTQSNFLNPFQAIADVGQAPTTGEPGKTMFHFQNDPSLPGGTAGPGPDDLNGLMSRLFGGGGGFSGGDSGGRGNRFV